MMHAEDLAFKHMGKRFRSVRYPNKNKTAKPYGTRYRINERTGKREPVLPEPQEWMLTSLQWFGANGNIIVNSGSFYLRPDTEIEELP